MHLPMYRSRKHRSRVILAAVVGAVSLLALVPATAASADDDSHGAPTSTYAVYGDSPYGADGAQYGATPAFIGTINADPQVGGVLMVGDLHSGSEPCTVAYDTGVAEMWKAFADPVYYTPGDNEWADCQKAKQLPALSDIAKGDPIANLAKIRELFFPRPGVTLGAHPKLVVSQSFAYDRRYPTDKQYVENAIWAQSGVIYVTINVPGGSNNDHDVWNPFTTGSATETPAQHDEYTNRTAADLRWLDTAFTLARFVRAKGVVIGTQADMWDPEKGASHLSEYEPIVGRIAQRTTEFGGPVLLFNGDSHVYRSDNPLQGGAPCATEAGACTTDGHDMHPTYNVANFHRIVVHGSTAPMEWLKLTVDPSAAAPNGATSFGPFSWQRQTQTLP